MSKYCPVLKEKVVYLTCQECEEKLCKIYIKNEKDIINKEKKNEK